MRGVRINLVFAAGLALEAAVPMPDDTILIDMFGSWVSDGSLQQGIIADNPERLNAFPAWSNMRHHTADV